MITAQEAALLPPLVLAYVGDAVWETYVRVALVMEGGRKPDRLHRAAVGYVSAEAQAVRLRRILPYLDETEQSIVRRGRNAKSGSTPRNAKISDYRASTGIEALLGYLHLSGQTARLQEIAVYLLDNSTTDE